jgi:uncharacterized membrane protein
MAAEVNTTKEKPIWQRAKVIYALVVVVLVYATIITLVLCGRVTITSDQIISFAELVLGFLVGGHTATDIVSRISAALGKAPAALLPDPVTTPEEPSDDPSEDR